MQDIVLACAQALGLTTRALCTQASPDNGQLFYELYQRGDDVPYLQAWSEAKLKQLQQDRRFSCTAQTN